MRTPLFHRHRSVQWALSDGLRIDWCGCGATRIWEQDKRKAGRWKR